MLEDRTVPAVVSVESLGDTVEGGAPGLFLFTRTRDDLSQSLTVWFTLDDVGQPDVATPVMDYFDPLRTATFGPGQETVAVPVVALADNEFEDIETVILTLTAAPPDHPQYSIDGEPTQKLAITDNAPQVTASAVWYSSNGSVMGQITLNRSGGDTTQSLLTWFEVRGTLEVSASETVAVGLGGKATFPASATSITINVNPDMLFGLCAYGEWAAPPGDSLSAQKVTQLVNLLNGGPNATKNFLDEFSKVGPLSTYNDLLFYNDLLAEVTSADEMLFGGPFGKAQVVDEVTKRRAFSVFDIRTMPQPFAAAVWNQAYAWLLTGVPDWPRMEQQIDGLIANLGDEDFRVRDFAQDRLKSMISLYANRNDLTRMALVVGKVNQTVRTSEDPEICHRASQVLTFGTSLNAMRIYTARKIAAAAAIVGWWNYGP